MLFCCSGFEGLIENLMSELPTGSVTYNRPVRCVHWNNTGSGVNMVTVECDDGERITADHVIITVPLGSLLLTHYIDDRKWDTVTSVKVEKLISWGVDQTL